MNSITTKIMTNILSLVLTAVMCFAGTGCGQDEAPVSERKVPTLEVVYDLPQGWEWVEGSPRTGDVIKRINKDDPKGFYKIGDFTFEEKSKKTSRDKALENYRALTLEECKEETCTWESPYEGVQQTVELHSEVISYQRVYVVSSVNRYEGGETWQHNNYLEKDGITYTFFTFGSSYDQFLKPLETVIKTVHLE